jgi:hypothetical protein
MTSSSSDSLLFNPPARLTLSDEAALSLHSPVANSRPRRL